MHGRIKYSGNLYLPFAEQSLPDFRRDLLLWFAQHKRSFPWRETRSPYAVLIAEKLLQQTAASIVVINAFQELTSLFPSPQLLAKASLEVLTRIIHPLGFEYRSRELIRLAQELTVSYNGQVPNSLKALRGLPGIGDYIARAVLSFAFEKDVAVVDTNVARFLFRVCGVEGKLPSNPARNKYLIALAETLVPADYSRDWNFAILDLCALRCRSRDPECSTCPVLPYCTFGLNRLKKTVSHGSGKSPFGLAREI